MDYWNLYNYCMYCIWSSAAGYTVGGHWHSEHVHYGSVSLVDGHRRGGGVGQTPEGVSSKSTGNNIVLEAVIEAVLEVRYTRHHR